jgi:hypothetical protein
MSGVLWTKQVTFWCVSITPLNGLRVRMWDKIARINNLVDSNVNPSNESLRDSFLDLLNYSAIAMMVLDGVWPEVQDND